MKGIEGDVIILRHLVDSIAEAVLRLEGAQKKNNKNEFAKMRRFILELHRKLKEELEYYVG